MSMTYISVKISCLRGHHLVNHRISLLKNYPIASNAFPRCLGNGIFRLRKETGESVEQAILDGSKIVLQCDNDVGAKIPNIIKLINHSVDSSASTNHHYLKKWMYAGEIIEMFLPRDLRSNIMRNYSVILVHREPHAIFQLACHRYNQIIPFPTIQDLLRGFQHCKSLSNKLYVKELRKWCSDNGKLQNGKKYLKSDMLSIFISDFKIFSNILLRETQCHRPVDGDWTGMLSKMMLH